MRPLFLLPGGGIWVEIAKDLVAASATQLILSTLSTEESYGYAIIQKVRQLSEGEMLWTDGMLYPVLHRLERQGLIVASWQTSPTGRKRKYYQIQEAGAQALSGHQAQWRLVDRTLSLAWESAAVPA